MSSSDFSARKPPTDERRGFCTNAIALLLGGAACLAPAAVGVYTFLAAPFQRKSQAGRSFPLTSLASLAVGDPPKKFSILADRDDAWNHFPNQPIGSVLLRRTAEDEVLAINVVCPHAGCSVQYEAADDKLYCPCHRASFDLSGKRLDATSPSPRDLDTLQVKITDGQVWVQFRNFQTGSSRKVPNS